MNNKPIRRFLRYVLRASLLLVLIAGAVTVYAAFPGTNGKIAFDSQRDGNLEVYVMNPDGSGQTNLTNNPAQDGYTSWSPSGTEIAFMSDRDGNPEIYVMNTDGSGQTNLSNNAAQDHFPAWSPDGTKIAFTSTRDGNFEVHVMNADGSEQTNLTNDPASESSANWSPDGTMIVFDSNRDGNSEIYVMNADGTGQTNLSNNPAGDDTPDWQPLYNFSGFFPPVDNPPALNVAKAGSAVPVKFSLNGDQGLNIFDTGYPVSQKITCDAAATLDVVEQTVTAGSSSLSYDPATDQYTYVWKTDKAWANTCRQLILKLNDGTEHVAYFKF
jgi:dipeptidyl aminopeptidase/acylaminoacyl peptidase